MSTHRQEEHAVHPKGRMAGVKRQPEEKKKGGKYNRGATDYKIMSLILHTHKKKHYNPTVFIKHHVYLTTSAGHYSA